MEEWIKIIGFEDYSISNKGRLINTRFDNAHPGARCEIMKTTSSTKGRQSNLILCRNGIPYTKTVGNVVLNAFRPKYKHGLRVKHKDNDPFNNRLENLCWQ